MNALLSFNPDRKNSSPRARSLPRLYVAIAILLLGARPASATIATSVDLTSGVGGIFTPGQSYNETRAADVTVLSALNLDVSFMTLSGIDGSGLATAVIYDANSQALIASAQGNLTGGTITLPISATLLSGHEYRIGFSGNLGDGTDFIPVVLPYTESSGLFQINGCWDGEVGGFPSIPNLSEPLVTMVVTAVPEPGTIAMAGLAFLLAKRFARREA